jgi:hypothetical protein
VRRVDYFQQAIALDPRWADPHAYFGRIHFALGYFSLRPASEMMRWHAPKPERRWNFSHPTDCACAARDEIVSSVVLADRVGDAIVGLNLNEADQYAVHHGVQICLSSRIVDATCPPSRRSSSSTRQFHDLSCPLRTKE